MYTMWQAWQKIMKPVVSMDDATLEGVPEKAVQNQSRDSQRLRVCSQGKTFPFIISYLELDFLYKE